jgi:tryptophan 2,3-dioxygenase
MAGGITWAKSSPVCKTRSGTGGVSYLRKMLGVVLFPEIWKLRTDL